MQAYCVRRPARREMKDARRIAMKNGGLATRGVCPTCGTKVLTNGK